MWLNHRLMNTRATFHLQKHWLQRTDSEVGWQFKLEEWLEAGEVFQHKDTVAKCVTGTGALHRGSKRQSLNTRHRHYWDCPPSMWRRVYVT